VWQTFKNLKIQIMYILSVAYPAAEIRIACQQLVGHRIPVNEYR